MGTYRKVGSKGNITGSVFQRTEKKENENYQETNSQEEKRNYTKQIGCQGPDLLNHPMIKVLVVID